jgi:hypothetical protein
MEWQGRSGRKAEMALSRNASGHQGQKRYTSGEKSPFGHLDS